MTDDTEVASYQDYLTSVIGTQILAVDDDEGELLFYLSDGSVLEFYADHEGGFGVEIHIPNPVH